jgi:phosphopantothenoylcysteine decarboxylase/phosphopantothenate--cysteine ligase
MQFGTGMNSRLKCIVTAGPAYEELDEVRRLTNFSTGTLGTELANFLSDRRHEVVLLRGQGSTCRLDSRAQQTLAFTTGANLRQQLQELAGRGADAVFHAAAVSDFTFGQIWRRAPDGSLEKIQSAKISTRAGTILAELAPTSKIIADLRIWYPSARLIGWKYELEGDRTHAIQQAGRQLEKNRVDACVVNGRAYGEGFGLLTEDLQCRHFAERLLLFEALESLPARTRASGEN